MEVIKRERLIKNIHSMVRGYKSCVNESAKLSQVNAIINEVLFSVESDHKAVVETLQKTISQYEESQNESNRFAQLLMSEKKELQNKIDELEKVCKNILFVDMDLIDQLSDMQKVHRFTKMRESLEALFPIAKGTANRC